MHTYIREEQFSPSHVILLSRPHHYTGLLVIAPNLNTFSGWRRKCHVSWVKTPGEVLPYMGYIGMCRCEGYGFQAVYSRIGYINQSVWV